MQAVPYEETLAYSIDGDSQLEDAGEPPPLAAPHGSGRDGVTLAATASETKPRSAWAEGWLPTIAQVCWCGRLSGVPLQAVASQMMARVIAHVTPTMRMAASQ